jgi:hypothetical protein
MPARKAPRRIRRDHLGRAGPFPNTETKVALRDLEPSGTDVRVWATEVAGGTTSDWFVNAYAICARLAGERAQQRGVRRGAEPLLTGPPTDANER